jgi:peptide/nickel transport system permease protein
MVDQGSEENDVGGSKESYRVYRRQRLRNRLGRWRKLWRIYYGSRYGKVGFWLLLGYVVLTLLSPVLTFHDPNYFIAPPEDSYAASQELGAQLPYSAVVNGTPLEPAAVPISSAGSYVVYTTTADGNVTAVGLGATPTTTKGTILPVMSPGWAAGSTIFPASVFALADYNTFLGSFSFSYSEYVVEGATHANTSEIQFAHIQWSGANGPGDGTPSVTGVEKLAIPGTLVEPPVSNSIPTVTIPSWGPFAQSTAYTTAGLKPAYLYTVTRIDGGYNLTEYYAEPLQMVWSEHLPGSGVPGIPQFFGSYYAPPDGTSDTSVLVSQGTTLLSYNPGTGALRWQTTFGTSIEPSVGIVIPLDYQIQSFSSNDLAFLALAGVPGTVVDVDLANGANQTVTSVPGGIEGVATSLGDTGYPTYITIVTPSTGYFLTSGDPVANAADAVVLPQSYGKFQTNPLYDLNSNLMILSTSSGFAIAISANLGTDPIQWRLSPTPTPTAISAPILIINANNGGAAVAFVTSDSILDVYATIGTDQNPLGPELNTPSGNVYLFGTNEYGQDVWSQFIASFVWDWEIGLSVAAGIMLLSVLVAMFIGYVGNWAASVVETVTLVLFLLPGLALLIVVASIVGPNFYYTLGVLTFVSWPFTAITLIGVVRQIKSRTFVEAARVSGAGTVQILRRHMLPNMTPLVAFFTALSIGGAVTVFSTLQFLGIAELTIPTWGGMLQPVLGNYFFAIRAPFWIWPPTLALTVFVFAFIFVSRGLDEVVNPRIRAR